MRGLGRPHLSALEFLTGVSVYSQYLIIVRFCALCSSWVVGEESFPRGPGPCSIYENKCCKGSCAFMQDIGCGGPQSEMRISS